MKYKPKVHFPTLKSYISSFYSKKGVLFPCLVCRGKGWNYDPDDEPDVIEGYKMVRRLKCVACQGTGEGCFEAVNKEWQKKLEEDKKEIAEFNKRLHKFKLLRQTLTDEDIDLLWEFEFDGYKD